MVTKGMEQIYQEVADILIQMIPEKWQDIFLYAEMDEGGQRLFFYYYPAARTEPVYMLDMAQVFNLKKQKLERLNNQLYRAFARLYEEFSKAGEKQWTNLTFMLNHKGNMKVKFDYDNLSMTNFSEKKEKWEAEYLQHQLQEH